MGNVATVTRADGGVIAKTYDTMRRLLSSTDPKSQTTQYAYDAAGNLVTLTDARGQAHAFAYDLLNRRTRLTYPDSSHEDWSYDAVGDVASYTARAGQVRTSTYDARNRELTDDWSDATPDIARTYDAAGRLLALATGTLSGGTLGSVQTDLTYAYDDASELLSETSDLSGLNSALTAKTVAYAYDADGNRASVTYPDGTVVAYTYTGRNQVATIAADGPPPLASYTYDLAGRRTGLALENGTNTGYTYDDANRLLSIDHRLSSTSFASFAYTYNAVNNRTSLASAQAGLPAETDSYSYDPVDQLTGVAYGASRTATFDYDADGNRADGTDTTLGATSYSANSLNQYTAITDPAGTRTPAYDDNGNLAAQGDWTYSYDAQNRLASAAGATQRLDIAYDGRNRPVLRTAYSRASSGDPWSLAESYSLVYDGWRLLDEYTATDTFRARYVQGPGTDEPLFKSDPAGTCYYHFDGLGSAAALTDGTGAVVESYRYDAFGQAHIFDAAGSSLSASALNNRFLFTGREWVANVELYDYRNRIYSIELGRFLQTDPLRFGAQDVNLYRYVFNSPTNHIDETGEFTSGELAVIAVVVAIAFLWCAVQPHPVPPPAPPPPPPAQHQQPDPQSSSSGPSPNGPGDPDGPSQDDPGYKHDGNLDHKDKAGSETLPEAPKPWERDADWWMEDDCDDAAP